MRYLALAAIPIAALLLSTAIIVTAAPSDELGYHDPEDRHAPVTPSQTLTWYHNNDDMLDIGGTGERTAMQAAFDTWESDPGSFIDFTNMGTTNNPASTVLGYKDNTNVVEYNGDRGCPSNTLAETNFHRYFDTYTDVDTMFNDACKAFSTADPTPDDHYDLQSLGLHEIGHWFVLNDLNSNDSVDPGPADNHDMVMLDHLHEGENFFDWPTIKRDLAWGDKAGVRYLYPNTYTVTSGMGTETQEADIASGAVDGDGMSDYIFAWAEREASASDDIKYMVGMDADTGTGQATWSSVKSPTELQNLADDIQGVGVAIAKIDSGTTNDLVIAWIDNSATNNVIKYKIGWNLDSNGDPTGATKWSTIKTVDTSNIGTESQGLGIAFADTQDAPSGGVTDRHEMFVFWMDNPLLGFNEIYYKVGWNINLGGDAAGNGAGTVWSSRFDTDANPGFDTPGLGAAIGDWLGASDKHDIILFWADNTLKDNIGVYKVGKDISSTGGASWSEPKDDYPGQWLNMGDNTQGTGVTLLNADGISNTGIDATFVWVDNPSGANKVQLRTEWGGRMGTGSHDSGGIAVKAVRQNGMANIDDLFVSVYDSSNNLVKNGYSPLWVPIPTDGTYHVEFSNYGQYYFTNTNTTSNYNVYSWGGRVTIDVTNYAEVHGVYFDGNNPGNYAKMTYAAKDTNGAAINGMYGGFKDASGNILSQGFSPYAVGIPVSQNVDVIWNDFGTTIYQNADLSPNTNEVSDNTASYTWGGIQRINLQSTGTYTDTGVFTP